MTSSASPPAWFDRVGLWLLAALTLAPLVWCWHDFGDLFWFGDEWDQLGQISRFGFWRWTFGFFGENFAPLFKVVWGSVALGSHGSYFAIVITVWLAHALCVALLGRWMRAVGFGAAGTAVAMLAFGLAATNVETLSWTIQLITVQGMLFFLAAGHWHQAREADGAWNAKSIAILAGLVALSTFSFVRGALTGTALAAATLLPLVSGGAAGRDWRTRGKVVAVCLLPAAISIGLIMTFAGGNHHRLAEAGLAAPLKFATWYFLLNPFHRLFDLGTWGPHTTAILGLGKILLLVQGWRLATPSQRRLLLALLVFELGNSALLGIGRFHTGLLVTTGSRYQYVSLITTLPFCAVCIDAALSRLRHPGANAAVVIAGLAGLAFGAARNWPATMQAWGEGRGRQPRHTLLVDPHPPAEGAVPGIDFMSTPEAKKLIVQYHLH